MEIGDEESRQKGRGRVTRSSWRLAMRSHGRRAEGVSRGLHGDKSFGSHHGYIRGVTTRRAHHGYSRSYSGENSGRVMKRIRHRYYWLVSG